MTAKVSENYIIDNLDKALDNGWIKVMHQPVIRVYNEQICNDEALARWEDPENGNISPDVFVRILEGHNLAYKLDLYVLQKVIKKMEHIHDIGRGMVPESINISKSDFYSCDFISEIKRIVDSSGIDRSNIVFELAEESFYEDKEFIKSKLNELRDLGFKIWLDNYGSSYSSIDVLRSFDFDAVKFDRNYLEKVVSDNNCKIVVTELIRTARALGSETIAEGVENKEQFDALKEIGCGKIQGFYYSKPLSFEDILKRYETNSAIGFENQNDAQYYDALDKVNLYDMSSYMEEDIDLKDYFDCLPMVVLEVGANSITEINSNASYRKFVKKHEVPCSGCRKLSYFDLADKLGKNIALTFIDGITRRTNFIIDENLENGNRVHLIIQKIAENKDKGTIAAKVVLLGYINNQAELKHLEELERIKHERKAYARLAALSGDYICMYSINPETNAFTEYDSAEKYSRLNIVKQGDDFFKQPFTDGAELIYAGDREMFKALFCKAEVMKQIAQKGMYNLEYRAMLEGRPHYVCLKVAMLSEDGEKRLIAGIIDIDSQKRKEQEYYKKLEEVRERANKDGLTGVKNNSAYTEFENKLNLHIDEGKNPEFAIALFDINNLKYVNDTYGHKAGDDYIKKGCKIICQTFKRSPVFRVGGDEFVAILQDEDLTDRENIINEFRRENEKRVDDGDIVIASGIAVYNGDTNVSAVFEKADAEMYKNKKQLKGR